MDDLHQSRYRPVRSPLISMGPSLDEERRRHRTARVIAVSSVVAVAVAVVLTWVIGSLGREVVAGGSEHRSDRTAIGAAAPIEQAGAPAPQTIAEAVVDEGSAGLRLQLPIRREAVTAIGFGPRNQRGVMELDPTGTRANTSWIRHVLDRFLATTPPGELPWYQLDDGRVGMATIGAAPGTEVYAPIDGTVQAITAYEIDGAARGMVVQLQPVGDPQTVVILRNLDADVELRVGDPVQQSATRLGTVRDMEGVVASPLADVTHDSGSGVDLYVLRLQTGTDSLF